MDVRRGQKITARLLNSLKAEGSISKNSFKTTYGNFIRQVPVASESAPSQQKLLYVKIIEGLSYDTDEETGRSRYWCRLIENLADDWVSGSNYTYNEIVTSPLDNALYICVNTEGVSGLTTDPSEDETNWSEISDEEILIFHNTSTSVDMRHYAPWLKVNKIYPVRRLTDETSTALYFEQQFTYIGSPGSRSIGIQESTGRMYACIGDTVI